MKLLYGVHVGAMALPVECGQWWTIAAGKVLIKHPAHQKLNKNVNSK